MGINPLNEGREYIEAPRWADVLIVISVLTFLLINFMTMMKTKKWTGIQGTLLGGLTFLALDVSAGDGLYKEHGEGPVLVVVGCASLG